MATRWADQEDSDEEETPTKIMGEITIPPTHKSRVDSKGIQIVTSYRLPSGSNKLVKTITKQRVTVAPVKESKDVQKRREWKLFGQAAIDEKEGTQTCVVSKEDIMIEDPNADIDLQDEDPTNALSANLNEFWAKQQKRQLQRKYDVDDSDAPQGEGSGQQGSNASASGWTQVKSNVQANAAAGGGTGKYVPPSARGGGAAGGGSSFPDRRDDLNTIRVTNLSPNVAESDLQDLFQRYGRISRVYLAKDKVTFESRGFAFVSFVSQSDAARAMEELQGHGYDHLILKLEWARPNNKDPSASSGNEYRSGYGKALAQDTKAKVSYASNLTKGTR